jgi:hypothetical protein
MMPGEVGLVLMAKAPVPGRVKTRLGVSLLPEQAAELHRVFACHIADRLDTIRPRSLVVCFDPPDAALTVEAWLGKPGRRLLPQSEGDLGARMACAARELAPDFERLLFLGCDSPDLPDSLVTQALDATLHHALVIGPTEDGGYWCIGFDRSVDVDGLLSGIPWSSGAECRATVDRAKAMGVDTGMAGLWRDVDRPDDLKALIDRLGRSSDELDRKLLEQIEQTLVYRSNRSGHRFDDRIEDEFDHRPGHRADLIGSDHSRIGQPRSTLAPDCRASV